jgi:two-component system, response regulator YesN
VIGHALAHKTTLPLMRDRKDYPMTPGTEQKIMGAISYIGENYIFDISREGLAASLGISPNHLGKYFKIHTGMKINEYINNLRIRDAAEKILKNPDESIINIAFSVGFESLSTFNRVFLKIIGLSPTEYREKNIIHQ